MGVGDQRHATEALPLGKRAVTRCIGSQVVAKTSPTGEQDLAPTGIRSPYCVACSELLYRLRRAGPPNLMCTVLSKWWSGRCLILGYDYVQMYTTPTHVFVALCLIKHRKNLLLLCKMKLTTLPFHVPSVWKSWKPETPGFHEAYIGNTTVL
jgi:hypothetical protein